MTGLQQLKAALAAKARKDKGLTPIIVPKTITFCQPGEHRAADGKPYTLTYGE